MKTNVMNILNAKEMVSTMIKRIEDINKDFGPCREEYEQAVVILRRDVGDEMHILETV